MPKTGQKGKTMKKLLMIIPLVILFYLITGSQQPGSDALEHAQPPGPVLSLPGKIPLVVAETGESGDFGLVQDGRAADLHVDADDFKVVHIAADCLASDVERVTGIKPVVQSVTEELSSQAVLIGTIGKSALIDTLMRDGKLDVRAIEGQWESFILATVNQPLPGVDNALVIAGSDRRGTAFGVFTLSEAIGVSPWVWWADVPPRHRASLVARRGIITSGPPSLQYRGIFINDEDWGLQPWSAKTFEPETGDIGPKTYAKVCELLLRSKANYLWPAPATLCRTRKTGQRAPGHAALGTAGCLLRIGGLPGARIGPDQPDAFERVRGGSRQGVRPNPEGDGVLQ
jgi:hypothetical protein